MKRFSFQIRVLIFALGTSLVTGCASMAPDYQRPAAPVPAEFPQAGAKAPANAPLAENIPWRDYFADPRLREVIAQALANNRDLRVATLNIEKARAQYQIQRADLFPSIGATGSQSAQRLPGDLTSSGEAATSRQYDANIGFTAWELDFFGRIRSLNDEAMQQYLATEEAQRSVQISLIAEVAQAWLTYAADRERLALANRTYATRVTSHELIQRSFAAGAVSELDVRQSESLVQSARADKARYQSVLALDENALTLLLGSSLRVEWMPESLAASVSSVGELPVGVPSEVLVHRPDILQAEYTLRAANANIGAARAAFFPSITLTAGAGTASAALDGLFASGSGAWSFMPQIRVPIFEAGRLQASLDVAEVQRDIGVAQYEKAIQTAFREVADVLAEKATLDERLDARRKLVAADMDSVRLSEVRYNSGMDNFFVLLDAQRTLFSSELLLIEVRLLEAVNRVTLYKVLGGGG
ncbi:MAG: AdeC/AdeK/OprM family multidrug efflux complex outer membrane factor [Halothiobacillaceae bacterium]|nr:AdeC/AdeK/OprM family multidrug efflux complex outer membrane factor [Halothiobacillaceae bacterium]